MSTLRSDIAQLIEDGRVPVDKVSDALKLSGVRPPAERWHVFISHLLLWLGGLSLACSLLFFIAYNWDLMGRYAKFGLVECFVVLSIGLYWRLGADSMPGKLCLMVASILMGVLMALYGQAYQTGADPWQLFFNWSLMIFPWVCVGCFPALWILWLLLANVSMMLYFEASGIFFVFRSDQGIFWATFLFNASVLVLWEYYARIFEWMSPRWGARIVSVAVGCAISWLVIYAIADRQTQMLPVFAWMAWVGIMLYMYQKRIRDLFMLAGVCLSGIVVIDTFLAVELLPNADEAGLLFLSFTTIGMSAGSAVWLKKLYREWRV